MDNSGGRERGGGGGGEWKWWWNRSNSSSSGNSSGSSSGSGSVVETCSWNTIPMQILPRSILWRISVSVFALMLSVF